MDELRKIRYLLPPLYFITAVAIGYHLARLDTIGRDCTPYLAHSSDRDARSFGVTLSQILTYWLPEKPGSSTVVGEVVLAVAGGAGLLAVGYLIGTATILVLRGIGWIRKRNYEAVLSSERDPEAVAALGIQNGATQPEVLVAAIDHSDLVPGLRQWIDRRWNAFNLSAHSGTALVLAWFVLIVKWNPGFLWASALIAGAALWYLNAYLAWLDTRNMNDLLVRTGERVRTRPTRPDGDVPPPTAGTSHPAAAE